MFIVKRPSGPTITFDAFGEAVDYAVEQRPALVYTGTTPRTLLARVHPDGGIDFTTEGATERRLEAYRA